MASSSGEYKLKITPEMELAALKNQIEQAKQNINGMTEAQKKSVLEAENFVAKAEKASVQTEKLKREAMQKMGYGQREIELAALKNQIESIVYSMSLFFGFCGCTLKKSQAG